MASENAIPSPARRRRAGRGRRLGWLKMSARFLTRSLARRATSFMLALLAVTVGAAVASTLLNLQADLTAKMSRELRSYGPNLLVTPAPGGATSTLSEARVRALAAPHISPLLIASGSIAISSAVPLPTTVVGADFEALRGQNPTWRVDGGWPKSGGDGSCLVGAALARRAGLSPGGEAVVVIAGKRSRFEVIGVVSTGESEEEMVYVPLPFLQERTGLAGRVSLAALSIDGGVEAVERAAASIRRTIRGSVARPLRPVAAAQGAILTKIDRMMFLLTAVVLVLSGLCLMTTLMGIVLERESEIGLMRSIGAGDRDILMMFLGEVTLLGLLGGTLGLILGVGGARLIGMRLFQAAIGPRAHVVPLVLAVALALCWIAILLPLRRALTVRPAAALRGY